MVCFSKRGHQDTMIKVKRIYDPPSSEDGLRYLVDRIWPRGLSKEAVKIDAWLKELAPSNDLRRWFGHDPIRWDEFQRRYFVELDKNPAVRQTILPLKQRGTVTLLFAARDLEHNNAVALKSYLESHPKLEK
jgi:uncharacterized protein YeaO (DUF488 family)